MWTDENRARYDRSKLRYPSDLTDAEWEFVRPYIPPCKRGGRQRTVDLREVVNSVMYVLSTGCQWRVIGSLRTRRSLSPQKVCSSVPSHSHRVLRGGRSFGTAQLVAVQRREAGGRR